MNIQHSSRNDGWLTPLSIIDRVKTVFSVIHLDPASDAYANKRIGAQRFYTKDDDALQQSWQAKNLFINPPGGKLGRHSLSSLFWQKLMAERKVQAFDHAIFLAFSVEALQNTQNKNCASMGDFTFCVPSRRVRFDLPEGYIQKTAPSHSNVIVYVPCRENHVDLFIDTFYDMGSICRPIGGVG